MTPSNREGRRRQESGRQGNRFQGGSRRLVAALTKPPPGRPLYDSSDEDRDEEDPVDSVEPLTELHPKETMSLKDKTPTKFTDMVLSKPYQKDPEAYLVYVSDERFDELQQWPFTVGPAEFNTALLHCVVGPEVWLENHSLFHELQFLMSNQTAYHKWRSDKKKWEVSEYLMAFGKGILLSHGNTNKVWGVDADSIYIPMSVSGNHWISLCIHFSDRSIHVFDCNGLKRFRKVDAFANMVLRIFKEVQPAAAKKNLVIAPYSVRYVPMRQGINESNCDCGIYALKFIECHVLGLDMLLLYDTNIRETRYKIACDLVDAAKDKVLLNRMSRYIQPEFAPTETVDIS
ncbi:unnamed protein product [Microthlaspi erraticum]|uniref:Ubiquitin-like protease family profile domain-containing protein n=1 Tax=Microthlaspi erraticum TaxID=1685480 RepID=A0A6D2ISY1_9BRAS|nr:unnamed protein product [Microthlaspi erraticum]